VDVFEKEVIDVGHTQYRFEFWPNVSVRPKMKNRRQLMHVFDGRKRFYFTLPALVILVRLCRYRSGYRDVLGGGTLNYEPVP